jgi:nanoRNase/pAp phosphatase (c-di-AMP/oligoRNAs hydrolase)
VVFYHAECSDGFGAAWAAWKRLGDDASYIPMEYGTAPPSLPRNAHVYILDFTFPRDVTEDMHDHCEELVVMDHHGTTAEELEGLPYLLFDDKKSGAVLAWEYFHPGARIPELLLYIMDRDLWQFRLPKSREVFAALASYPADFQVWDHLEPSDLAREGEPILRYQREIVSTVCNRARLVTISGHRVPVVNTAILASDVGQELLKRFPDSPFSASYFDRPDAQRQWSLRSRPDFDVSTIAKKFGNGGHPQAAGFETPLSEGYDIPQLGTEREN